MNQFYFVKVYQGLKINFWQSRIVTMLKQTEKRKKKIKLKNIMRKVE